MSEKINELYQEAVAIVRENAGLNPTIEPVLPGSIEKQFADFIVKECIWQIWQCTKDNQVPHEIQVLIENRFREHFGIEEVPENIPKRKGP